MSAGHLVDDPAEPFNHVKDENDEEFDGVCVVHWIECGGVSSGARCCPLDSLNIHTVCTHAYEHYYS